jgi:hypothetical protein
VSGRHRLALVAAAASVAFVGFLVARRAGVGLSSPARPETEPAAAPVSPAAGPGVARSVPAWLPTLTPPSASTSAPTPDTAPAVLTPGGAALALEAIGKNEQTRQLFMRLQRLGLSREQRDRVLLILGTQALRPAQESPTLQALRTSSDSRVLLDEEANRVRDERQEIAERALLALRPALAAVLTPSQLARAGPGSVDPAPAGQGKFNAAD